MNPRRQLLATTGAALAATAVAGTAQASAANDADTLYGHGMVWNRDLPGLAGRLNLAFDLRVNLRTGTGAGSAGDPAHPGQGFQFAISSTRRERVRNEQRFFLEGQVTDAVDPGLVGAPVRIAAQTQGDTTAIVIRVGDAVYTGAGLVVIAIIAILIGLLLPAVQ
ncbi:MAG: hypothetical protein KF683_13750 [Rubrivivax sp.]|nr:hypothetical protein [Rubrivivax sp.]